jgi:hypothetical protein
MKPQVVLSGVLLLSAVLLAAPASAGQGGAVSQAGGGAAVAVPVVAHSVRVVIGGVFNPFWWGHGWGPYWEPGYYGPGLEISIHRSGNLTGSVRLNVTGPDPKSAKVFANGGYVGVVGNFNGRLHEMHLQPGTYDIQVEAEGYQPLTFTVRIQAGQTITYRGNLQPAA